MGQAQFSHADFLDAARALVARRGPGGVTVGAVIAHLKAPVGSFYHRFASRDVLLGELWLANVRDFQEGFCAAIDAGDGLKAALHGPLWARAHLEEACLLLLHKPGDFVRGEWPKSLTRGVAEQLHRWESSVKRFARAAFGSAGAAAFRRARFVLTDAPLAALRPHLERRERPPAIVDELIRLTYRAIVGDRRAGK